MTNSETDNGTTREDLVQRVALMETDDCGGRRSTARFGWVFVMWGLIYFVAMGGWFFCPSKSGPGQFCVAIGILVGIVRCAGCARWAAAGTIVREALRRSGRPCASPSFFMGRCGVSGHGDQPAYYAAVLFFVGLAHGASAGILRWGAQGLVAFIWWGCGIAMFFFRTRNEVLFIFLVAAFFGMILFGLYAMMLERRRAAAWCRVSAGPGAEPCLNFRNSIRWSTESCAWRCSRC